MRWVTNFGLAIGLGLGLCVALDMSGNALAQDATRGLAVYEQYCSSCHRDEKGAGTWIGPTLYGVYGAQAGLRPTAQPTTSESLQRSGVVWNEETLDALLSGQASDFIRGMLMPFGGIGDGQARADVIAYLKSISPAATDSPM